MAKGIASDNISARIRGGESPSAVLRSVLEAHPETNKSDLLGPIVEAFPLCNSIDMFYALAHWKESKRSQLWDERFDLHIIGELIRAKENVPWSIQYCEEREMRIRPKIAALVAAEKEEALQAMSYDQLLLRVKAMDGKPVCIQALWDGDSNGWFIRMSAILLFGSEYIEKPLGVISCGGDIRLFNGAVPPWPESEWAKEVGVALAKELGAAFYFPSPEKPDDTCASWLAKQT